MAKNTIAKNTISKDGMLGGAESSEDGRSIAPTVGEAAATRNEADRCECGEELVRINLLIDGEELTMCSCSNCDRRSWHRGGEQVALDGVLADISSVPTRYRRDLASR